MSAIVMRRLLLELSMECESLARSEAIASCHALSDDVEVVDSDPGVLVIDTSAKPERLAGRLALCHYVSDWLGTCKPDEAERVASELEVEGPVRVRSTKVGVRPEGMELASLTRKVGGILAKDRGVDLRHPRSDVRVVVSGRMHFARVISAIDRASFEKRKNRHLPFKYPASLHPKYARALVNLTRVPAGGKVLDPFCGTGAIVSEAAIVGLDAVGADFSERMLAGAKRNIRHLGLEADLVMCDVGEIAEKVGKVSGVATDPPYGRSTSTDGESISELYSRAFKAFGEVLDKGSRVAVVLPEKEHLESTSDFSLEESHSLWVHRSLTRHFCVLRRS